VLSVGQICCFVTAMYGTVCSVETSFAIPEFINEHLCIGELGECSADIKDVF
jgi:hypothetical protein